MTGKLIFTEDRVEEHPGSSGIFSGRCLNVISETYAAPHTLHLKCLLVSLFSLTPPPAKKYFAGPDWEVH